MCDGDARVALGALELAFAARAPGNDLLKTGPAVITLEDFKDGIKVCAYLSHIVFLSFLPIWKSSRNIERLFQILNPY